MHNSEFQSIVNELMLNQEIMLEKRYKNCQEHPHFSLNLNEISLCVPSWSVVFLLSELFLLLPTSFDAA
jgi:hypothetical protein